MPRAGWTRSFVGAALILAIWPNRAQAGSCSLPAWNTVTPMNSTLWAMAVTSDGSSIYAAGGATALPGAPNSNLLQAYNPALNTWTNLTTLPTIVAGACLASVGGKLYLFGGVDNVGAFRDLLQLFDIAAGTWSAGPPMPGPRAAMGCGVINGKVYLVSGCFSDPLTNAQVQNWEFAPGTSIYTPRAPVPRGACLAGAAVSEGRLHFVAGQDATGVVNRHYAYSPPLNTWAPLASITTAVNGAGAVGLGAMTPVCHGDVIVIGGGTQLPPNTNPTTVTQLYDIAFDFWSTGPPLSQGRFSLGAAQAGDTLIAVGGHTGSTTVATVDRIQGPPLPVQLQGFRVE